jgi:hypothetical protein
MPAKKLTLIFEANTRSAVTGVRTLTDEVSRLQSATSRFASTDINKSFGNITSQSQAFLASLTQSQNKLNQLNQLNQLSRNISSWETQQRKFNDAINESINRVRNLTDQSKKTVAELSKPIETRLKVTLDSKEQQKQGASTKEKRQTTQEDTGEISNQLRRKIERENREIRANLAKEKEREVEKTQTSRTRRQSKAETIISQVTQKNQENAFFKTDEVLVNRETSNTRRFATEAFIKQQEEKKARLEERNQRASQAFSTVVGNEPQNRQNREEAQQNISEVFNQRLKQQVENRKRAEAEAKRQEQELLRQRQQEAKQAADNEKRRQDQIRSARKAGLQYREDTTQDPLTSSGVGFGRSNLRRSADVPPQRNAIGGFLTDAVSRRAPQGIQEAIEGTRTISEGLGLSRIAALGVGAAISGSIVLALTAANFAMAEFNRQVDKARKDQLAMVGISSETQRLTGVDRKTADAFYERLQTGTEIAGRDTSVSAEDITNLNTRGTSAFLGAYRNSGRSLEDISKQIVDTNTRFAILAQSTPGVTNFQVQNAYTSAVTGNLGKAIDRQEFFKNSGFGDVIKQTAEELGVNLKKATQSQQIDVLQASLQKRVPQELIGRLQTDSIDAQLSSFQDTLFAQRTGIFGIQRDLDIDIEGSQSVFTEVSRTVNLVFGKQGFLAEFSDIFGGINFDIMKSLRDAIRGVNVFLENVNTLLNGFNRLRKAVASIPVLPGVNVGRATQGATDVIGTGIGTAIGSPFSFFQGLGTIAGGIGNTLNSLFGGNSYSGNLPDSSKVTLASNVSFVDAIKQELANKPPRANLLIANDAEYIFPDYESLRNYAIENIFKSVISNESVINNFKNDNVHTSTKTVLGDNIIQKNKEFSTLYDSVVNLKTISFGSAFRGNLPTNSDTLLNHTNTEDILNSYRFVNTSLTDNKQSINNIQNSDNGNNAIFPAFEMLQEYAATNQYTNTQSNDSSRRQININQGAIVVNSASTSPLEVAQQVVEQLDRMLDFKVSLSV